MLDQFISSMFPQAGVLPQPPAPPYPRSGGLSGFAGQFQVPDQIWSILPALQKARMAEAYRRRGMGGVAGMSQGQPWGSELMDAFNRRRAMSQQPQHQNANPNAAFMRPTFPGQGTPQGVPFNGPQVPQPPIGVVPNQDIPRGIPVSGDMISRYIPRDISPSGDMISKLIAGGGPMIAGMYQSNPVSAVKSPLL